MHVHIGMENYINADRVFAVARNRGNTMKRLRTLAAKDGRYFPMAGNDATRSLIFMDNGVIFGSCVTAKTLSTRFNTPLYHIAASERVQTNIMNSDGDGDNDEYYLDDTFAPESEDDEEDEEDDDSDGEVE